MAENQSQAGWMLRGRSRMILIGVLLVSIVVAVVIIFVDPFGTDEDVNTTNTPTNTEPTILPSTVQLPTSTADADSDGLTDDEEAQAGTKKDSADSDDDGLFDREELQVYTTDPLSRDTDRDGIADGEEVNAGTNPKGAGVLRDLSAELQNL